MSNSDLEQMDSTPPEIIKTAALTASNLLPTLSRERYEAAYNKFIEWKKKNNANSFSENVLLAYFADLKQKYQSSTLWSVFSMLRTAIIAKHDINIAKYLKLKAVLKKESDGYQPKKSNTLGPEEIKKFIETAPDEVYLLCKVVLAFGISGALRKIELCNVKLADLQDLNSALLVKVPVTKNKNPRSFTLTGQFYELYKKYANLRPPSLTDPNQRFFVNYQKGKCTCQFVGINKFGKMVQDIAKFLKLPNPQTYTGHSFRRSSATILVDSGEDLLTLKRHGGWKSSTVAEGYINDSINRKIEISDQIVKSIAMASTSISSISSTNVSNATNDSASTSTSTDPTANFPLTTTTLQESVSFFKPEENKSSNNKATPIYIQNCSNFTINFGS